MNSKGLKEALADFVLLAAGQTLGSEIPSQDFGDLIEVSKEEKFGDYSTHYALKAAKIVKKSPRQIAEKLRERMEKLLGSSPLGQRISKIAVEGPGFINFFLSIDEVTSVVRSIHHEGENFGRPTNIQSKKILLEFVSANPTGPLTVAHGRQAALGDSLAKILNFCGHKVTKEYYNNDEGVQIQTLGKSTHLRVKEILEEKKYEMPADFYQGDYLIETALKLLESKKDLLNKSSQEKQLEICTDFAKEHILGGIKKDLDDFGVSFDNFYSQKELGRSGKVEKTLDDLGKKDVVYESEGALWFRSTAFGDDKDRVLIKSDKHYTYLTPDIAYHHEKFLRGFDEVIDILGPDHHGYIARLKASQAALGHDPDCLHVLIAQLVTLYEGTKQVRMSTRAGEFVTLRQILDEVGKDAGRFFFVMRKFDAHLDFDLELAKSQTPENPVFYIQYAHARIESVKTLYEEKKGKYVVNGNEDLSCLSHSAEMRLMRLLGQFEDTVSGAARTLEPYRLVPYLMELAAEFHRFYTDCRIVADEDDLASARLMLALAVQRVLKNGLTLLGVSAPLKM